ncbi:septum formation initiator family protein [Polaromonas jejuensis]|uniref:Cell division protein FtsB n=1 Tax=Polaromonas jejuensis TaxID=457502 RepID=A0ABW0Q5G6_9BURK|nr:septum formation initiator family protein [Polaromonas jejuensis]
MGNRFIPAVLIALLLLFHAQLWVGRGSLPSVREMQQRLDELLAKNVRDQASNDQLAAEVRDLKEGLEMVEEKARGELGMVKPNEIFVQITPNKPSGKSSAAQAQ